MQTFVPSIGFMRSASQLDLQRLGKQRLETDQILGSIIDGTGYRHHPVNDMWRGYEDSLVLYGLAICHEWRIVRRKSDTMWGKFAAWMDRLGMKEGQEASEIPPWAGDLRVHRSHRSNLIRKDPVFYRRIFGDGTPEDMPYLWPHNDRSANNGYTLMLSRADFPRLRSGERILPQGLEVDPDTREVFGEMVTI